MICFNIIITYIVHAVNVKRLVRSGALT
jgi:hypothetical protein